MRTDVRVWFALLFQVPLLRCVFKSAVYKTQTVAAALLAAGFCHVSQRILRVCCELHSVPALGRISSVRFQMVKGSLPNWIGASSAENRFCWL